MNQVFFSNVYGERIYGKYAIHIQPGKTSNVLISLKNKQAHHLKIGKNIIPIGEYELRIKKEGFFDIKTNFTLTTTGLSHRFELGRKPFSLKIESRIFPVDVYFNGQQHVRADSKLTTLSNIPQGFHEIYLSKSSNIFFYKSFHSKNDSFIHIKANRFYHYKRTLLLSGILGLVPGLNYFVHFPKSTAGFVIPSLIIHYFLLTGYIFQSAGISFIDANFPVTSASVAENNESIQIGLLVGVLLSSVLHSVFSFLGTKKDLDVLRSRHLKKLNWGFDVDIKSSKYKAHLLYKY